MVYWSWRQRIEPRRVEFSFHYIPPSHVLVDQIDLRLVYDTGSNCRKRRQTTRHLSKWVDLYASGPEFLRPTQTDSNGWAEFNWNLNGVELNLVGSVVRWEIGWGEGADRSTDRRPIGPVVNLDRPTVIPVHLPTDQPTDGSTTGPTKRPTDVSTDQPIDRSTGHRSTGHRPT